MRILLDRTLRRWGQCIWTALLLLLPCVHLHATSVIQFSAEAYEVAEDAGAVEISVQRTNDLMAVVSAEFATDEHYSATPGADYTAIVTHLVFLAGETNKIVSVPILNDAEVEGPEVFQVVLRQPGAGAALGRRSSATVTIIDNDRGLRLEFGSVHEDECRGQS